MTSDLRARVRQAISEHQRQRYHTDLYANRQCRTCERDIPEDRPVSAYCSDTCRKRLWDATTRGSYA